MDNNSGMPDSFYWPAYKLLAQVSSHPLTQVIDIHLDRSTFKHLFVSTNAILVIRHAIFRHASVSSTYLCKLVGPSVGWSVSHTFGFPISGQ